MHVEIYQLVGQGEDQKAGTLHLVGGAVVPIPPDSRLLKGILAEPIWDAQAEKGYDAETTPEEWLRALHRQYTSAYLRCSPILDDDEYAVPEIKAWM